MKAKKCVDCGKEAEGEISVHGLCPDCSWERQKEAQRQIKNKSGPFYEKWKAGLKRSLEE